METMTLASDRARLYVDGVQAPIVTTVARRHAHGMTLRQALPFLRLQTRVHDDQRVRSRIKRVTIDMDGDVPQLVVELSREREDTVPDLVLPRFEELAFIAAEAMEPAPEPEEDAEAPASDVFERDDEKTGIFERPEIPEVEPLGVAPRYPLAVRPPPEPWLARAARVVRALLARWLARAGAANA
jgi:hypothetical protein